MAGIIPYRDYFTASTPLNALKSAAILSVFGDALIVTRLSAVLERVAMGLILYFWLARFFRRENAALAAILTMVVSAGDISDPIASYNHDTIFWTMAAGLTASFLLDAKRSSGAFVMCALLSGLFAGCAFSTKQTIGLGATVCIPFVVAACLLRFEGWRKMTGFAALFAVGWLLCAGLLLAWIAHLGALQAMLDDIFRKGPAAKAKSPVDFATRFATMATQLWPVAAAGIACLLVSLPALRRAGLQEGPKAPEEARPTLWAGAAAGAAIALGAAASYAGLDRIKAVSKPTIFMDLFGVSLLLVYYGWRWLWGKLSRREAQFCLLATVSFVTAFMLSLSFPVFEAMLLPGVGFLAAALLDTWNGWRRNLVYAACLAMLLAQTCSRLNRPYGFEGWEEPPVREAHTPSTLPQLRGLLLPEGMARFVDGTVKIIEEHSSPSEPIFIYPELGIFYTLTNRKCSTFTSSHNIDVVNDEFARSEAKRLLENKPAVLIFYRQSEVFLEDRERMWRHGNRSGQRDIIAAVETLAAEYRLAASYQVPPDHREVVVYVRH